MLGMRISNRFKLATLLLSAAGIAAVYWWIVWPEVTARRFLSHCTTSVDGDASFMNVRSPAHDLVGFQEMLRAGRGDVNVALQARTFGDLISGRRNCVIEGPRGRYRFSVARGAVIVGPTLSLVYGGQDVMLDVF